MSDLFKTFIFDLQRFAVTVPLGDIKANSDTPAVNDYVWSKNASALMTNKPITNSGSGTVNLVVSALTSTTADGTTYANGVLAASVQKIDIGGSGAPVLAFVSTSAFTGLPKVVNLGSAELSISLNGTAQPTLTFSGADSTGSKDYVTLANSGAISNVALGTDNASVTIDAGKTVSINGANTQTTTVGYTYTHLSKYDTVTLAATGGTVNSTAQGNYVIPFLSSDSQTVTINATEYTVTNASGNAAFKMSSTDATDEFHFGGMNDVLSLDATKGAVLGAKLYFGDGTNYANDKLLPTLTGATGATLTQNTAEGEFKLSTVGTAQLTIGSATVKFTTGAGESNIIFDASGSTAKKDNSTLTSINLLSGDDVTVGGMKDKDVTIITNGTSGVINTNALAAGGATASFNYKYESDTVQTLDLSTDDTSTSVTVASSGNATQLKLNLQKATKATIGGTEFKFNKFKNVATSYFMMDNGTATGFVFGSDETQGKLIISEGTTPIAIYDSTDTTTAITLPTVTGGAYAVGRSGTGEFTLVVGSGATVTDGTATLDFGGIASKEFVAVKFGTDGKITSVAALDTDQKTLEKAVAGAIALTDFAKNDSIVVTGDAQENVDGGIKFGKAGTANIATKSGSYTYGTDKDGNVILTLNSAEEEIHDSGDATKVFLSNATGTLTDSTNNAGEAYTYKVGDAAYFSANGNGVIDGFVFAEADDAITLPDGSNFTLNYYDNKAKKAQPLGTANVGSGEYTVTMTTATTTSSNAASFELSGLGAEATANVGTAPGTATFTFSDAGGVVQFNQSGTTIAATGFTATAGTVTMDKTNAVALLAKTSPTFNLDGTAVTITAKDVVTDGLVYTKEEASLSGLGTASVITDAGALKKIYAPTTASAKLSFYDETLKKKVDYTVTANGTLTAGDLAYFELDGEGNLKGFHFGAVDDAFTIPTDMSSDFMLYDAGATEGFKAPIVYNNSTNLKPVSGKIVQKDTENFLLNGLAKNNYVTFGETQITVIPNSNSSKINIEFNTKGELVSIDNVIVKGDSVIIAGATQPIVFNDDTKNPVEVINSSFTYTSQGADAAPLITDVYAGATIKQVAGAAAITTAEGEDAIGKFTFNLGGNSGVFGLSSADPSKVDGLTFTLSDDAKDVKGVTGVNDSEILDVTSKIFAGGFSVNSKKIDISGDNDTLGIIGNSAQDAIGSITNVGGASVVIGNAGGATLLSTDAAGKFTFTQTAQEFTTDDTAINFTLDRSDKVTAIGGLSGVVTGGFSTAIAVNGKNVQVEGADTAQVTGNDTAITKVGGLSGTSVNVKAADGVAEIGAVSDGTFQFDFAASGLSFALEGNYTEQKETFFQFSGTTLAGISGLDNGEAVKGDFANQIKVEGSNIQVVDTDGITVTNTDGALAISGLTDGAEIKAADGTMTAATEADGGAFTDAASKKINVAGGSATFALKDGVFVGVTFEDGVTVSGDLNGVAINGGESILVQKADGSKNIELTYVNGTLSGIKNGDTVVRADSASTVRTAEAGTFTFGIGGPQFETDDASIDFALTTGTVTVTEVNKLDAGKQLSGALSGLAKVNGAEFNVIDPNGFAVVGAESGISAISQLSNGAEVVNAGGASLAITDAVGTFKFPNASISVVSDSDNSVNFKLNTETSAAEGVTGLDGVISADNTLFEKFTVNGQSIAISGDENDLAVTGAGEKITAIGNVGGTAVTITKAGGASAVSTDKQGMFIFASASRAFLTANDDTVTFTLDKDGNVTEISEIGGASAMVSGSINGLKLNGKGALAVEGDAELAYAVFGEKTALLNVGGTSVIVTNAAGVDEVVTDSEGAFVFADSGLFAVAGDDKEVIFEMDKTAAAKVEGISGIGNNGAAAVGGTLDGLFLNGKGTLDIVNDADGFLSYAVADGAAVVGSVSGTEVAINNIAGASTVEITGDGDYTFSVFQKGKYVVEGGDSSILFTKDSISDLTGTVTGDFSAATLVNEKAIQVEGDAEVAVVGGASGVEAIANLSNGAKVVAAQDVTTALTDGEGTFKFANGEFSVAGDSNGVSFLLDGAANVVGVEGLDDGAVLSGALSSLTTINGVSVAIKNDNNFAVVGASVGIKSITGISNGADIVHAGGAQSAAADTSGTFTFSTAGQSFLVDGSENVKFQLDSDKVVAIDNLTGAVTSTNFGDVTAINGASFAITGDEDDLTVIGNDDASGLTAIAKVGGASVVIGNVGGASAIFTDKVGNFTFAGASQAFATYLDAEVEFGLDAAGKVTAINALGGGGVSGIVAGDINGVAINGGDAIDVVGDTTLGFAVSADGAAALINVGGESVAINNVGGAEIVSTDEIGNFKFAGNDGEFSLAGEDTSVTFQMAEGEPAKVVGISGLGDSGTGSIGGKLGGLTINGNGPLDITGDSDEIFDYTVGEKGAVIGGVSGAEVAINNVAGASRVDVNGNGAYTFFGEKTFAVDGIVGEVDFGITDGKVTTISDFDKGEKVSGSFEDEIKVNGQVIQVAGDSAITVEFDDILIRNLSNGATIVKADDIKEAWTDKLDGEIEVTDADGHKFTVAGTDEDGVKFVLDGKGHVTGVESLGEDVVLSGALSVLDSINQTTFEVKNDAEFAVVGASNGIKSITGISDGADVVHAGGAKDAETDTAGKFVFSTGGQSFTVDGSENVKFNLNGDKVVAIENLTGSVVGNSFDGVTAINGQSFAISGDDGDLKIVGTEDAQRISEIANVGGENVTIQNAGGATFVTTDKVGAINFAKSNQNFAVDGDAELTFELDDEGTVTAITGLSDGTVSGNLNGVAINDNAAIDIEGDEGTLAYTVNGTENTLDNVGGDNVAINNVGGAKFVATDKVGTFNFAENEQPFDVAGDENIRFEMDTDAAAKVVGISELNDGATIGGALNELKINGGNALDIQNDEDGYLTYEIDNGRGLVGGVKGEGVEVNSIGAASAVEINGDGDYTFGAFGKGTYAVAGDSSVIFTKDTIEDLTGTVTGDFGATTTVNGKEIQVAGDSSVGVIGVENGVEAIEKLSNGAEVVAAEDVKTATTDSAGTFKFANGEFSVAGDSAVIFQLDGKANVVGVDGLDEGATLTGKVSGLTINGQSVIILNDETFSVVGNGAGNGIKSVEGISDGADVVKAGGASNAQADSAGTFVFSTGGQSFLVEGSSSVNFVLNADKVVAIENLDGAVTSETFDDVQTVNGKTFDIVGDENDLKIFGKVNGITAFDKVGGETVSINDAGGASAISTDVAGEFTFTKAQQTFKTDDADLLFDIDANEKVLGVDLVDKSVTGNFDGVKVNGQSIEITDGDSSQKVFGNLTGVTKIAEVDSEATISNVGGASVVETKTAGKFAFNNGTFEITGDDSVQFAMKSGSAADVAGVTSFGDAGSATLSGELDGVYVNKNSNTIDVKGDADGVMAYALNGENAVIGNVGGSAVAVNAIAGASVVEIVADGKYTFGAFDKGEYEFALNETPVKVSANAINELNGTATGDFASETSVNGKAVQVTGDAEVAVVGGDAAVSAIEKLSGGATVEKAEDVATANTDSAGTFKFANGEFSVAGDSSVTFQLDGKANVVGVNGLDEGATLTGAINGLSINGQSVNILNDETFGVVGNGADNGIKAITGLTGGASIVNAGGAETAYTDSEGEFTFTDGQKVAVYGDSAVALGLNSNGTLAKVDEMSGLVDADSALLANVPVNGKLAQLEGDVDNLIVVGTTDAKGIESLVNVGPADSGELTVVDAAGASTIFTDKVGTFKFTQSGQTFTLAGDSSVVFTTDANGKVVAVEGLNENGVITGDFTDEISVNGDKVQVTGDANGIAVAGSSEFGENGVTRISGVDAGATVAQWGNAAKVDAVGTGAFTFGSDSATAQKFTNTGDADGLFTFATATDKVTGVEDLQNGTLNFSNNVTALDVNVAQVTAQSMSFASETEINLTVADYKVNGATLASGDGMAKITGLVDATVQADGAIYVNDGFASNGKLIDIQDNDALFGVEVASGAVTKATSVTGGDATISAADATIETDAVGAFNIGGKDYTINDDGNMTFITDSESQLAAVSNIEGWVAAPDAKELALDVNGNAISITNSDAPVTIGTNGSVINGVNGLADGAVVAGDLADAAIRTPGTDSEEVPAEVTINGKKFGVYGDADGVVFNGANGAITDLADEASLKVAEAGVYTVNSAVLDAKEDDIIIGRDNQTDAYIYNPENVLVRANTPIKTIENMTRMNMAGAASFGGPRDGIAPEPLNSAESEQLLATADLNQTAEIWLDNADDKEPQALNFRPYNYAKEVHSYEGTQAVAFNDEGGNMAHVQSEATGKKDITLGNGGDVVVMDEAAALGNAVNITGGAGDDSVFVRGSANTTFDMSKGGADRVAVFGGANARVTLDNYNAATDGGLKIDEGSASVISDAIDNGTLGFGDGVVSVKSAQGVSEIYVNDNQTDGTLVNLFTPSGEKQVVGFTNMTGGSVDGSAATEDLILIGNDKGQKTGGSMLVGGAGSDTIKAGGGDVISTGAGNDLVQLQDNATREGAAVVIGAGRTTLTGMNNTLAQSTGDTLSFDLSAAQKIELDENGNLVIDGNGFYAVAPADVQDGNYVTQFITDTATGTTYKAAIGGKSAVMKVTEDEDVRPNSYLGHSDGSGVDFSEYTGPVTVDLKGDIYSSNIDGAATFFNDGILTLIGGSGNSVFKGGDANETFVAGSGYGSIYGDGGHNLMVGYTGADKTGSTTFFVLGNADGAANTIRNFDFVSDDNYTDNSKITADKIEVDTVNNYVSAVSVSGSDVFFEVANRDNPEVSETVVVEGALGKDMRVGNNIAQVNTDTLVFDKFANHYMAMGKNATVYVDSSVENVNLWLDDDSTGKNFEGDIKVIDARANGASAELSGNAKDNVIYAGSGNTSLWGGGMGDDLLVGNTGKDSFYYNYGDGNDSIDGAGIGDEIILGDMTLDDIAEINVSSAAVEMRMNDGGKLTINDGSGVDFKVAGETYALNEQREFVRK